MSTQEATKACQIVHDPRQLEQFLVDLLDTLYLQAKESNRLARHFEALTGPVAPPSELPLVISELVGLHERLRPHTASPLKDTSPTLAELRGQRIPRRDMDTLC